MTKQINELMALADEYANRKQWSSTQSAEEKRIELKAALEAALGQPQPVASDAAVAAIQFSLSTSEGRDFLRLWNYGDFDIIRREWPDVPDAVFVGADPLYTAAPPAQTLVQQCAQCGKEHKKCSSGGCPKCAPGVVVSESEFRKPITAQTPMQMSQPDERGYATFAVPPPRLKIAQLHEILSSESYDAGDWGYERAIETAMRKQLGYD